MDRRSRWHLPCDERPRGSRRPRRSPRRWWPRRGSGRRLRPDHRRRILLGAERDQPVAGRRRRRQEHDRELSGQRLDRGRQSFALGTIDFAVSDLPYGLTDSGATDVPPTATHPFKYLPIVAGTTAFMYHLEVNGQRVTNLRMTQGTVAKIFTGGITYWDDPELVAENPQQPLPHQRLTPVVRSDGAGTTWQLTNWLATRFASQWDGYCRANGRPARPAARPPSSPPGRASSP
ncbi:substrate-binding domain-containing protein [Catenulispora yoronensis]